MPEAFNVFNARTILLLTLLFLGMLLFSTWQEENPPAQVPPVQEQKIPSEATTGASSVPQVSVDVPSTPDAADAKPLVNPQDLITVETDVFKLKLSKKGGDVVFAELKEYPASKETPEQGFILLDQSADKYYIAQTGLISNVGPDSRSLGRATYQVQSSEFKMSDDQQTLDVVLTWSNEDLTVNKVYQFERGSYLMNVRYDITNKGDTPWVGRLYGQIQREAGEKKSRLVMNTYEGGALYTPEKKFKKVSYSDMRDGNFKQSIEGGWAAMVEHYFLGAWIPNQDAVNDYFTSVSQNDRFNVGALTAVKIPAQSSGVIQGSLYLGPEITSVLEGIAPGLDLTVDYGILWPISQLIFSVMTAIHKVVGNWGWSIILVTVLIKLIFFKLSASSYRSMGHMRRVQPKIEALKKKCGDDKQRFSQEMMGLYKKEKINPLGGCLPILVQIPVFIALYYVLLESVELRQAPFMLWIQDLSAKDPYFVLPIIMGASMLVQQKLSPAPPDPMQAKMLMLMPIVFTFLFLTFPAGLVLYWVVNNLLSIAQQWIIMRNLEKEGLGHKSLKAKPS